MTSNFCYYKADLKTHEIEILDGRCKMVKFVSPAGFLRRSHEKGQGRHCRSGSHNIFSTFTQIQNDNKNEKEQRPFSKFIFGSHIEL